MSKSYLAQKGAGKTGKAKRCDAPPIPLPYKLPAQLKYLADVSLLNKWAYKSNPVYTNKSDTFFISYESPDFKLTSSDRLQFANFYEVCDTKMKILVLHELIGKENARIQRLEAGILSIIKQIYKLYQEQTATKTQCIAARL